MSKEKLIPLIVESVKLHLGSDYHVEATETIKNNSLKLTGITIRQKHEKIFPVIYIDQFLSSDESVDEITRKVLCIYEENSGREMQIDTSLYDNFEGCRQRIIFQLVNTERNKFLLKSIPSVKYLDFSIIFKILLEQDTGGSVSAIITNKIMNTWNVNTDMLYKAAMSNTPVLQQYRFNSMGDIIAQITGDEAMTKFTAMYVLTNDISSCGCGCILYPHLLETIGECIGMDFFILPSSVHETLLVPAYADDFVSRMSLVKMVRDINRSCIAQEDFLSDNVYIYSRKDKTIKIV